jgi:transcriptional regulator with XRE-family HTH domain
MAKMTSVQALAHVLREGRLLLGESPEQVGGSIGISGRTIRRLETAENARPREITLTVLAAYYNLNAEFVRWLARVNVDGSELETRLMHQAERASLRPAESELLPLALMLARHRPAQRQSRQAIELENLQADVGLLNERRRRLVRQFVEELRLAQSEELRRREVSA